MGADVRKPSAPQKLTAECRTERFDCGNEALNTYLQSALKNQELNNTKCFVAVDGSMQVVGYYTISSHSIPRQSPAKPRDLYSEAPNPVPTVLLGRFAVDVGWQGRGIGSDLLLDAFQRIASASDTVGMRAVIVDAKNAKANAFYRRLGFRPILDPEDPNRLYLLTGDLLATVASLPRADPAPE